MKRKYLAAVIMLLCLAGCSTKETEPVLPAENLKPRQDILQKKEEIEAEAEAQMETEVETNAEIEAETETETETVADEDVWLSWESVITGTYPFDWTAETLYFAGEISPELELVNEGLRNEVDNQRMRYESCLELGEDKCLENGESWGDIWAYPVVSGEYLNAITVWKERMYFKTGDEKTWDTVSSIVYDTKENRVISIEEAFEWAGTSLEEAEQAVSEYIAEKQLGMYEGLSSYDFMMLEGTTPVFMIGALLCETPGMNSWPVFFTWTDGKVELTEDHPVLLHMVDTRQDWLSCLYGMGQYEDTVGN